MIDLPIIFSGPMIRALLSESKTMTRRILKPQPELCFDSNKTALPVGLLHIEGETWPRVTIGRVITKQQIRYKPRMRLWVRENWKPHSIYEAIKPRDVPNSRIFYAADNSYSPNSPWRPSIFMPRWASRITLEIEAVKVEPIQEISESEAQAEGATPAIAGQNEGGQIKTYRTGFVHLWNKINGTGSWLANPFVVAVTFSVHKANIDSLSKVIAA